MRRLFGGKAEGVDWSPDGTSIAFTNKYGVHVWRLDGGKPRQIVEASPYSSGTPAWAPNGDELAVVRDVPTGEIGSCGKGCRFEYTFPAIFVVRLDGSGLRRLLPRHRGAVGDARPGSVTAQRETGPTWSPDGTQIAFEAGDGTIVAADIESGHRVAISSTAGSEPAWSPDGRLIAYQCQGDVWVANADGSGDEHRVASHGGSPSWSPDSRLLVFEQYLVGGRDWFSEDPRSLSIVDTTGDNQRALTFGPSGP